MKNHIISIVASVLAICIYLPAFAQVSTSSISGRIVNGSVPVEGAAVVAINGSTGAQYSTATDAKGYYHILEMLPGGPYTIRIADYYGSGSVSLRSVYLYVAENTVIDADLEEGSSYIRTDGAASVTRLSSTNLPGGTVSTGTGMGSFTDYLPQPDRVDYGGLWKEPIGQMSLTQTGYDVRQDNELTTASMNLMTKTGTTDFNGVIYEYYTNAKLNNMGVKNMVGATLSGPLGSDDLLVYGTAEYNSSFWNAYARVDWRINDNFRFDATVSKMNDYTLMRGELISASGKHAYNNLTAGYYSDFSGNEFASVSDSYILAKANHKLTFGGNASYRVSSLNDTSYNDKLLNVYAQDELSIGRRFHLAYGVRIGFPFAISPRMSFNYDICGNSSIVLRGGVLVDDRNDSPTTWKMSFGLDKSLPQKFVASADMVYGQNLKNLFVISSRNILEDYYSFTGKISRPLSGNLFATASYTRANQICRDRVVGSVSYRIALSEKASTTFSASYHGYTSIFSEEVSPWKNTIEARVTQGFHIGKGALGGDVSATLYGMIGKDLNFVILAFRYSF